MKTLLVSAALVALGWYARGCSIPNAPAPVEIHSSRHQVLLPKAKTEAIRTQFNRRLNQVASEPENPNGTKINKSMDPKKLDKLTKSVCNLADPEEYEAQWWDCRSVRDGKNMGGTIEVRAADTAGTEYEPFIVKIEFVENSDDLVRVTVTTGENVESTIVSAKPKVIARLCY